MKFSIIMPSYLGDYRSAAKNRESKIVRAIDSALCQTYKDFELIIVADGCKKTVEIASKIKDPRLRIFYIEKQNMWSGMVRNTGIVYAQGEWIVYLDIDDMLGEDHLKVIAENIKDEDWVWFHERSWDKGQEQFNVHYCALKKGKCGTSNIAHRKDLEVGWLKENNYLQDFKFILNLMKASDNYKLIETPQYLVCHVPHILDYDGLSKKMS